MLSMAMQSGINCVFTHSSLPCQTPTSRTIRTTISTDVILKSIRLSSILDRNSRPTPRNTLKFTALVAPEALAAETPIGNDIPEEEEPISDLETQVAQVVVKQVEKPRLVLKFIWMEKNIGLALDQVIPGQGTVPLSPYYFWPRKDAWEELKATLESKPWISQKKMIILLNQATDIINLWQQSGGNITSSSS